MIKVYVYECVHVHVHVPSYILYGTLTSWGVYDRDALN